MFHAGRLKVIVHGVNVYPRFERHVTLHGTNPGERGLVLPGAGYSAESYPRAKIRGVETKGARAQRLSREPARFTAL